MASPTVALQVDVRGQEHARAPCHEVGLLVQVELQQIEEPALSPQSERMVQSPHHVAERSNCRAPPPSA